ncbi:hypothetical protein ACQ4M4_25550 [Leptolyngbya sp. AN02str]|uniref:hypothetical protein n=1 Tax=Leptolyngbya sp. AN02str TaxID=3423363 RepID=UPI003D311B79
MTDIANLADRIGVIVDSTDPMASVLPTPDVTAPEEMTPDEVDSAAVPPEQPEDFEIEETVPIPLSKRIGVKVGFVSIATLLVTVSVFGFYSNTFSRFGKGEKIPSPEELAASAEAARDTELEIAKQEAARAQAELALLRQQEEMAAGNMESAPAQEVLQLIEQEPTAEAANQPEAPKETTATSASASASSQPPAPAPMAQSPGPNRTAAAPRAARLQASIDPFEEWSRIASSGRFGVVQSVGAANATTPRASPPTVNPATRAASQTSIAPNRMLGSVQPVSAPPRSAPARGVSIPAYTQAQVSGPSTWAMTPASATPAQSLPRQILVGTNVQARTATPVSWTEGNSRNSAAQISGGNRFFLELMEPVKDSANEVVLPEDTQLVVTAAPGGNGVVELTVVSVVVGGQEFPPPSNALSVRGADGGFLIGRSTSRRSTFGHDTIRILTGAAQGTSRLQNRSRSSTRVTNNGTVVESSENPAPDYLAGAIEGGVDRLIETMDERNDRATDEILADARQWQIRSGTRVRVFFNQSVQLPRRAM